MPIPLFFCLGAFSVLAVFFAALSYSILIRRRPVVLDTRWLVVFLGLALGPAVVLGLLRWDPLTPMILQLLPALVLVALLGGLAWGLPGLTVYGITEGPLRQLLGDPSAEALGPDDLVVRIPDWLGAGLVRARCRRTRRHLGQRLRSRLADGAVETKTVTAVTSLMVAVAFAAVSVALAALAFGA